MTLGSGIAVAAVSVCVLVGFLAWIMPQALFGVGIFLMFVFMMILLALTE